MFSFVRRHSSDSVLSLLIDSYDSTTAMMPTETQGRQRSKSDPLCQIKVRHDVQAALDTVKAYTDQDFAIAIITAYVNHKRTRHQSDNYVHVKLSTLERNLPYFAPAFKQVRVQLQLPISYVLQRNPIARARLRKAVLDDKARCPIVPPPPYCTNPPQYSQAILAPVGDNCPPSYDDLAEADAEEYRLNREREAEERAAEEVIAELERLHGPRPFLSRPSVKVLQ